MGKDKNKLGKVSAGVLAVRQNIVNAASAPGNYLQKNKDATIARWDSIYETSRLVAVKYIAQLQVELPDLSNDELVLYMQDEVFALAESIKDLDGLVDRLTLYVCVVLELEGGNELDVTTRRKCMKLIENTRKLNKTRRVLKKVETGTRIIAAIATLLPDKGRLSAVKKLGNEVSGAFAAKDLLEAEVVNAFENNGVKNPAQQGSAKRVISATAKIIAAANRESDHELEELENE